MTSLDVQPSPLVNGGTATITVSGAEPGSTVTVTVDNGGDVDQPVEIPIDSSGNGTGSWSVPDWPLANFNTPGAEEVTRSITSQPHH